MQRFFVKTEDKPCKIFITLQAEKNTVRFCGKCPKTKTFYFLRKKEINGLEVLEFPLPIAPKIIEIWIEGKCKVKSISLKALPEPQIKLKKETYDFIRHIFEFSKKLNTLGTGIYTDDKGRFPIVLSKQIRNRETGKVMNTPARVSRNTGQIEVSQEKFKQYTVPMRVFVLMHERSHYELQSSNELECDLQALQWYLGFGFPQTEAIYANTKIFNGNNPEHLDRAEQLLDYIKHYNYATASYDNGFCGACQ
ncbi:MAG: hypothetical protein OHK0045_25540 [Raineya sp.]